MLLHALMFAAGLSGTDTTVGVRPGARLMLHNQEGSITITTWNRSEVRVQAEHGEDIQVDVSVSGSSVSVRGRGRYGPEEITYRITVPAELELDVYSQEGDVTVSGTRARVEVQTVEGDVSVSGGAGAVRLQSVEGDLTVSGARARLSLNTVDGAITVRDSEGDVSANAVDGAILLDGVTATEITASTVDGDIAFSGTVAANGRYELTSHDGDITVTAPSLDAAVTVSTFNGEFETDFPVTVRRAGAGERMDFTLGSGSARLSLESFDGRVTLRKGGVHATPAKPGN